MNERRGITRNEFNLGVLLNITDEFIPELSMNEQQDVPPFELSVRNNSNFMKFSVNYTTQIAALTHHNSQSSCPTSQKTPKYQFTTLKGEPSLDLKPIYYQAENLVKSTFAKYDIVMDLNHTLEDGFTCDILVSRSTVIAVQEFVLMKNYVWLESLVVSDPYRRQGIGKNFIKRLIDIAKAVKKSILLYSLMESLPFYFSCGFQLCPQCTFLD